MKITAPDRSDVLLVLGLVVVTAGVWMIHRPAAVILAGLCLVGFGVVADLLPRNVNRERN